MLEVEFGTVALIIAQLCDSSRVQPRSACVYHLYLDVGTATFALTNTEYTLFSFFSLISSLLTPPQPPSASPSGARGW